MTSDTTSDRWARIADLFDRAADLDPAERAAFLDREAVGPDGATDGALREEVERLLAADLEGPGAGAAGAFLDGPLGPDPEAPPPTAGPWRLTERVGRGGMGEVWRAERRGAFEQTAAVKLVRPGLGESLVARFRAERQILAGLDHPSIARLLDGGKASDGRPYLATEFVEGEPLTAHCDRRRLGVNERLAVFAEVCDAVAYAHARLVVHRDLKPSNVMVSAEGRVKLLDFGIAKLLDAGPGDGLTRTGRPVLTPAYAAPEQAEGGPVTTATDVYGLGVLLYELLTGTRPHAGATTRPSDAVTTSGATGGRVPPDPAGPGLEGDTAALRSTTADRLRRRLRGDLDRIALKALRADPDRRYRGAAELGADVRRHLDGLPVEARPESTAYRVSKFVGRHRGAVAAAVVALAAVVGGAGAALWQAAQARDAQAQARDAQAQAEVEAATADGVSAFVTGLFGAADPDQAKGDTLTVLAALGLGADRARTELADQPNVRAAVLRTIGDVYRDRGRLDLAEVLLVEAASIEAAPRVRADAFEALGILRQTQGEYAATDSLYRLALRLRVEDLGTEHPDVASSYQAIGVLRRHQGGYEQAVASYRRALRIRDRLGLTETSEYATDLSSLGVSLTRLNRLDEADGALRRSIQLYRVLEGDTTLLLANAYNNLGTVDHQREDYASAEANYLRAIDIWRYVLGADHPNVAIGLSNIANMYLMKNDVGRGRPFLEESLALFRSRYPEEHPEVSFTLVSMSSLERLANDLDASERYARQALGAYASTLPPDHPHIGNALHGLGRTLRLQRDPAALEAYRRALAIFGDALSPDDARRYSAEIEAAEILAGRGDLGEAHRYARAALPHALEADDGERVASARAVLARR